MEKLIKLKLTKNRIILIIGLIFALICCLVVFYAIFNTTSTPVNVSIDGEIRGDVIIFRHNGGEPLHPENIRILIDTKEVPIGMIMFQEGNSWPWSIGEIISVPYSPSFHQQTVMVQYSTGEEITEIFTFDILPEETPVQTISPTLPTPTALPSPVPTPISTPGNPEARFTASPRTGPLPLTVIFLDLSSGVPDSWAWEFGDGGSSEEQNPVHTYTETGTFSVSLQVKNIEGAHTRIMQEYVNVTPAQVLDVAVSAETEGFIRPDGFAQFSVTGPGSRIKIGGQVIRPETGDTIMLVLEREGKGSISIIDGQIVDFSFDNILLYQNSKIVTSGYLSEIFIPSSAGFLSTFVLEIPPSQGEYRIKVEGVTEILQGNEKGILVMHLQPDRSGMMLLDTSLPYSVQYRGGAVSISY